MNTTIAGYNWPVATAWNTNSYCSLLKHLTIQPGRFADYLQLSHYHYRQSPPGPPAQIWVIRDTNRFHEPVQKLIGVVVYTYPTPNSAARNAATNGFFNHPDRRRGLRLLNKNVRCISRVIIEPRWRGLGLASLLLRMTMPQTQAAMVETMTTMGCFHPLFDRAGMTRIETPPNPAAEKLGQLLCQCGIRRTLWHNPTLVQQRIELLPPPIRDNVERKIHVFIGPYGKRRKLPPGPQRTAFILEKLTTHPVYYYWFNKIMPASEPTGEMVWSALSSQNGENNSCLEN